MANEYKLSYTAAEIDERLGQIDNIVKTVNGVAPDKNGNVKVDIPEGGASVQSDFAQNWETDPSYVKNRPIHDAWNPVVVDDIQLFFQMDEGVSACELLIEGGSLIEGQTYTIRYNGNVFTAVCKNRDDILFIGSEYFFENFRFEDENDKFSLIDMGEMGCMACFNESLSEEVERHLLIINGEDTCSYIEAPEHFMITMEGLGLVDEYEAPIEDAMKGMTIYAVIDGVEQTLESDVLTLKNTNDVVTVHYDKNLLVRIGLVGLYDAPGIYVQKETVKAIDFNSPVFAPCLELKRLDEKFLPILTSPSGKRFSIAVDDNGSLIATEVAE